MAFNLFKQGTNSFYRTLLVRVAAIGVLLWVAVSQFGFSREDVTNLLIAALWVVGCTIGVGALCALLWVGVRKLMS